MKKTLSRMISHKWLYVLILPSLIYLIVFCYIPMYGIVIAFKDYNSYQGIAGSAWAGFKHFRTFFNSPNFSSLPWNTLRLSVVSVCFNMPLPILLALGLNETNNKYFKKGAQYIFYAPYFVSNIVLCGMCFSFLSVGTGGMGNGIIVRIFSAFGVEPKRYMSDGGAFLWIYIVSGLWQGVGWWSIMYSGALANVDKELHEAAMIDGAGKFKRVLVVDLPVVKPLAVINLLLNIGQIMNLNFEKVYLLQTAGNLAQSEIISTYIYRITFESLAPQYSLSTAVGLFNTAINVILLAGANFISKKLGEESLW